MTIFNELRDLKGKELYINKGPKFILQSLTIHNEDPREFSLLCKFGDKRIKIPSHYVVEVRGDRVFLSFEGQCFLFIDNGKNIRDF